MLQLLYISINHPLVIILIVAVILWLINYNMDLTPRPKLIINVIIAVALLIWVLALLHILAL